ncbi:LuxR C-terminal-related transcriptional regulator [Micromonospora sp. NPDC007230]|uniref:LuxR C-terminal-related transcriptional regulator n=1 Tax=Micromonospora sp. NPDC007230 TaxID=3364237 RepID=UPI003688303C
MPPDFGDQDNCSVIGLAPAEQTAYELLIERPSATLADLDAAWSRPEPLAEVLAGLEERSLISREAGPPVRFQAASPAAAFGALFADYEEQLERARRHVAVLDAAYQAQPAVSDSASMVEVITGPRAVRQRWLQIERRARQSISCLAKPPYLSTAGGLAVGVLDSTNPREPDRDAVRRDLTWRTIYDRSAIKHPGSLAAVERSIQAGQLARVLPDLPISLWLADAKVAFLPLQRHTAAQDAIIVVHPSALLDALVSLFEGLWQRALPLHRPAPGQAEPDDTGRLGDDGDRLITLLLSGLTDEAIARQLGLSHRTVQRRVAALMANLGAHSRFQAGVRAALQQAPRWSAE